MNRRRLLAAAALLPAATGLRADPSAAERKRIEQLLQALAQRRDAVFIRNGKEYSPAQAAEFLQGKLKWQIEKIATAQDFIDQIGTRSDASGTPYQLRLADGRLLPTATFFRQELAGLDRR
jgi:hypothetical protein